MKHLHRAVIPDQIASDNSSDATNTVTHAPGGGLFGFGPHG
ncbi:hypothetical protein [Deinococcus sp. Arct2-2]|nr:hypothetical protein [Deinococcus sp. Arct2-2]